MPEVISDRAKEFIEERMKDSIPPTEESQQNDREVAKRMDASPYAHHTDAQLEALVRAWLAEYRSTCDTMVYRTWTKATGKDIRVQAWTSDHYGVYRELRNQMKAVRDSCNGL